MLFRTTNGGTDWNYIFPNNSDYFMAKAIDYVTSSKIVSVGQRGKIYQTDDGGNSWNSQTVGDYSLTAVNFYDANKGVISNGNSEIYKTADGGKTWTKLSVPNIGTIYNIVMTNENEIIVTGYGEIMKTADGGLTWTNQKVGNFPLRGLSFYDANNGMAADDFGLIFKTIDGGKTWAKCDSVYNGYSIYSISMSGKNNAIAVGRSGLILCTTDGGNTWIKQESGTTNSLHAAKSVANGTTWVTGDNCIILKSTIKNGVDNPVADVPTSYLLNQNYPNPFNPATKITYSLPENSRVILTIYNYLGQKVAELVNRQQGPGNYEVQWNAGNVASGAYIYELRTNKFRSFKKMILLK
jgi:photosystem II stability/assembly factor-like uncharacterized protein